MAYEPLNANESFDYLVNGKPYTPTLLDQIDALGLTLDYFHGVTLLFEQLFNLVALPEDSDDLDDYNALQVLYLANTFHIRRKLEGILNSLEIIKEQRGDN